MCNILAYILFEIIFKIISYTTITTFSMRYQGVKARKFKSIFWITLSGLQQRICLQVRYKGIYLWFLKTISIWWNSYPNINVLQRQQFRHSILFCDVGMGTEKQIRHNPVLFTYMLLRQNIYVNKFWIIYRGPILCFKYPITLSVKADCLVCS